MHDLKRDGGAYLSDYDDEIRQAKECLRCSADFERRIAKVERERDEWRTKYEAIRTERDKVLPSAIDTQQQTCQVCERLRMLEAIADAEIAIREKRTTTIQDLPEALAESGRRYDRLDAAVDAYLKWGGKDA